MGSYFSVIQAGDLQPYSRRIFTVLTLYINRLRSVFLLEYGRKSPAWITKKLKHKYQSTET